MIEVTKISSKGQIVIPFAIRKDLDLGTGSQIAITKMNDYILLKKVSIPDIEKEFKQLTNWGSGWAKKKGIKSEEDVLRIIHKGRG